MDSQEKSSPPSSSQRIVGLSSSIGGTSGGIDSWRSGSIDLLRDGSNPEILDEIFAQIGDSGGRVVDEVSRRTIQTFGVGESRFARSVDMGATDDVSAQLGGGFRIHPDECAVSESVAPLPAEAVLYSREQNMSKSSLQIVRSLSTQEKQYVLPCAVDNQSYLTLLAVFGILGVNTEKSNIILEGIQLGFLGCMSTVSTFAAEVYAMRQSGHSGRALAYALSTLIPAFIAGMLIYSLPLWKKHYA